VDPLRDALVAELAMLRDQSPFKSFSIEFAARVGEWPPDLPYRDWSVFAFLEKVSDPDGAKHPEGRSGHRGQTPLPQRLCCRGIADISVLADSRYSAISLDSPVRDPYSAPSAVTDPMASSKADGNTDPDESAGFAPADEDPELEGISLEELGQAYAEAMAQVSGPAYGRYDSETESLSAADFADAVESEQDSTSEATAGTADMERDDAIPTPGAIIEAALFIGNPENRGITEAELAALMRDVTPEDVSDYVDRLNESYQSHGQAFRIHRDEDGLRLGVAPDMEIVRRAFYGKIRETRLSQPAIEVLSLVAYQPGITADKVETQRGKESGSLLSQLVRRRLLEQRRVIPEGATKPVSTYYPTERFMQLFGLQSLDDLPQVEG